VQQLWLSVKQQLQQPAKLRDVVRGAKAIGWTQDQIAEHTSVMPNIGWQFLAYLILTSAEIMVSIVCLEFAYTQSPPRMKSFVMGVYFLGVSLGNFYVSGVNTIMDQTRDANGHTFLDGPTYYYAFAAATLVASAGYIVFAMRYKGDTFIQGEQNNPEAVET